VAIRHPTEKECIVLSQGEGLRCAIGAADLEVDGGGHGVKAEMLKTETLK
jgi:hypothetical protein